MHLTLVLLFYVVSFPTHVAGSKAETLLYKELLTGYNKLARPVRNVSDPVKVQMKMHLQQIMTLDGKNQILELNAWLKYIWTDYRLAWNSSQFENIESIRFAGGENQIWRPDVLLYNSANENYDATYKSNEVVYSSGEVNWVPPGIFLASCKMDITYFPFDDQSCFMEFGSWSYQGELLDLRFSDDNSKGVPAIRRVSVSRRTGESYPTIIFYMNLRRRTLFYLFNIILPSMLISFMTLIGFCLPAHDMSEKIGFQTTILLSICFFVTIVSEMTPPTSESVPLLGVFFSALTLIVSASTAFTITVLNLRYRQDDNHKMSKTFYQIFLVWLPWLLLMKRPGVLYRKKKEHKVENDTDDSGCEECVVAPVAAGEEGKRDSIVVCSAHNYAQVSIHPEGECNCEYCRADEGRTLISAPGRRCMEKAHSMDVESGVHPSSSKHLSVDSRISSQSVRSRMSSMPEELLHLRRKRMIYVGDGIFSSRAELDKKRLSSVEGRLEKYVSKCMDDAEKLDKSIQEGYLYAVAAYYTHMHESVRLLNSQQDEAEESSNLEEWKFAAMTLDRLCLILFTFFIVVCITSMITATPYVNA